MKEREGGSRSPGSSSSAFGAFIVLNVELKY